MGTESVLARSGEGKELTRLTTVLKSDTCLELSRFHSRRKKCTQWEPGAGEVPV
jgi:hypothetical protein